MNKLWQTDQFLKGPSQFAPTNFYPLLSGTPTDAQVERMLARWLTNTSEFCLSQACAHGIPSIARSSPAFNDNSYWRGRNWGPMSWLVYLGLERYSHLSSVAAAKTAMSTQVLSAPTTSCCVYCVCAAMVNAMTG